ncbi:hypothetical protein Droror1_Dr00013123 [Drosera rotundifolia]
MDAEVGIADGNAGFLNDALFFSLCRACSVYSVRKTGEALSLNLSSMKKRNRYLAMKMMMMKTAARCLELWNEFLYIIQSLLMWFTMSLFILRPRFCVHHEDDDENGRKVPPLGMVSQCTIVQPTYLRASAF